MSVNGPGTSPMPHVGGKGYRREAHERRAQMRAEEMTCEEEDGKTRMERGRREKIGRRHTHTQPLLHFSLSLNCTNFMALFTCNNCFVNTSQGYEAL